MNNTTWRKNEEKSTDKFVSWALAPGAHITSPWPTSDCTAAGVDRC